MTLVLLLSALFLWMSEIKMWIYIFINCKHHMLQNYWEKKQIQVNRKQRELLYSSFILGSIWFVISFWFCGSISLDGAHLKANLTPEKKGTNLISMVGVVIMKKELDTTYKLHPFCSQTGMYFLLQNQSFGFHLCIKRLHFDAIEKDYDSYMAHGCCLKVV